MKKRIASALLASALVLAAAGCGNNSGSNNSTTTTTAAPANNGGETTTTAAPSNDSGSDLKDDGETLSILAWNGNSDAVAMRNYFLKVKGYDESKVTIVTVGENGEGARDGYSQYLLGDGDADLMICDADWIQQYVNSSDTVGYDKLGLSKSDFPDAFSYTLSFGTSESGEFKANSFQATPGGFVYRADLAKEYLGASTPDEMQALISDWDKFEAAAKTVQEMSNGACSLQATEGGLWQVFQSNRSQPWVVDGKLVIDNAADFYDIAKRFYDNKYMAGVPQWDAAWYAAVLDGTAMGDFVPTWGLTTSEGSILFNFTEGKEENGKNMAICEGPSGWFWGGSYFALAAKCDNKSLAKEWIECFCKDADLMKGYAEETHDFVNNKTVMSTISNSNPLLNGQNHYEILVKVMANLDLEGKITKYDSKIKACFNDSVNAYLEGNVDSKEAALDKFLNDVAAAIPDIQVD